MFDYYLSLEASLNAKDRIIKALDALLNHSPTVDVGRVIMTVASGGASPIFFYNSVARIRSEKDPEAITALLKEISAGFNGPAEIEFSLLFSVPSGASEIDVRLLPTVSYVRPLVIELAEHNGAKIDERMGYRASGLSLDAGRSSFGRSPVTLFRDPATNAITSRPGRRSAASYDRISALPNYL